MELQQITDLRAEGEELHALLATLKDTDWARETQFKRWTINDVVQHLHIADQMAFLSATDEAGYDAYRADVEAERAKGINWVADTRRRLGDLTGARLHERWRSYLAGLCDALAAKPAQARLKWPGPGMGVRMFATARQMETWAHSQAIYDLLGVQRPAASPRLRNIAEIGVRTFAWAYRNRGREEPSTPPYIRLETPFGEVWEWNEFSTDNAVIGDAIAFCQVVTQTRNMADISLRLHGATAEDWMRIVQCFAGPANDPPSPGTRFRMKI